MADAYTSTGSASLGGTVGSAGLVQKAYDRLVEFALRSQPLLRSVADKRPSPGTLPGSSIALQLYNDLTAATSTLSETVDPDAVALATPNQVVVTLNEYGNAVVTTRKLQLFSLADVDPAVANIVAYNMADSIDKLVMTELRGGTNVRYSRDSSDTPTSTATVEDTDTMKAADIRFAVAKLRGQNAVPRKGSLYWVGIHPEVAHDLRAETGAASWRNPHEYQSNQEIWAGEIGQFEGAYFVESNRLYAFGDGANATGVSATAPSGIVISGGVATVTDTTHGYKSGDFIAISGATPAGLNATWEITVTGANTYTFVTSLTGTVTGTLAAQKKTKVYRTIVAGQQALAEAVAEEPHVVIGPVTDKLMRLRPIGWYGVLGFKRYREDALFRIESASTIA